MIKFSKKINIIILLLSSGLCVGGVISNTKINQKTNLQVDTLVMPILPSQQKLVSQLRKNMGLTDQDLAGMGFDAKTSVKAVSALGRWCMSNGNALMQIRSQQSQAMMRLHEAIAKMNGNARPTPGTPGTPASPGTPSTPGIPGFSRNQTGNPMLPGQHSRQTTAVNDMAQINTQIAKANTKYQELLSGLITEIEKVVDPSEQSSWQNFRENIKRGLPRRYCHLVEIDDAAVQKIKKLKQINSEKLLPEELEILNEAQANQWANVNQKIVASRDDIHKSIKAKLHIK